MSGYSQYLKMYTYTRTMHGCRMERHMHIPRHYRLTRDTCTRSHVYLFQHHHTSSREKIQTWFDVLQSLGYVQLMLTLSEPLGSKVRILSMFERSPNKYKVGNTSMSSVNNSFLARSYVAVEVTCVYRASTFADGRGSLHFESLVDWIARTASRRWCGRFPPNPTYRTTVKSFISS